MPGASLPRPLPGLGWGSQVWGPLFVGHQEEESSAPAAPQSHPAEQWNLGPGFGVRPSLLSLFFRSPLKLATFSGCEILVTPSRLQGSETGIQQPRAAPLGATVADSQRP